MPGLAAGEGVAAVFCAALLDRLEHQCELEQKDWSMQDEVSIHLQSMEDPTVE